MNASSETMPGMLLSILSIRVSNFKVRLVSGLSASSMAALISDTTIFASFVVNGWSSSSSESGSIPSSIGSSTEEGLARLGVGVSG